MPISARLSSAVKLFCDTVRTSFERASSWATSLRLPIKKLAFRERFSAIMADLQKRISGLLRYKRLMAVIAISVAAMIGTWIVVPRVPPKVAYYIAYVGRDPSLPLDQMQIDLLTKYIEELNAQRSDVSFELKPFFIVRSPGTYDSADTYRTIAADDRIVVVIDNTWGVDLAASSSVIADKDKPIPVISMNADQQGISEYGKQVIFIGYDDFVPRKIAHFADRVLQNPRTVIFAERPENFPSTGSLLEVLPDTKSIFVDGPTVDVKEKQNKFSDLKDQMKAPPSSDERQTLILNTHSAWGDEVIDEVNRNYYNVDIIGGPYVLDKSPTDAETKRVNTNRLFVFTESSDLISDRVHREVEKINDESPGLPLHNIPLFVERCLNASSIIAQAIFVIEEQQHTNVSRPAFVAAFESMAGNSFVRNGELYSFDDKLHLVDDRTFEQDVNREVSSYPIQLNSTDQPIPNIHVGIYDIHISFIDTGNRSFHAEFNYWLKYDDPSLDAKSFVDFRNWLKAPNVKEFPIRKGGSEGTYRLFAVSGDFKMDTDLTKYPLDSQVATIEIEANYSPEEAHVSFDQGTRRSISDQVRINSDEWEKKESYVTLDNVIVAYGGTSGVSKNKPQLQRFEQLNIRNLIRRRPGEPFLTIILPLLMMGIASVMLLYAKTGSFSHIGHICVGLFVAIATYRISVAAAIPNLGGLSVVNKLFFGTFLAIFFVFLKLIVLDSELINRQTGIWIEARMTVVGHMALVIYCLLVIYAVVS
jgi:hypothetical protein